MRRSVYKIFILLFDVLCIALVIRLGQLRANYLLTFKINGDEVVFLEVGKEYMDPGAELYIHNINATKRMSVSSNVDTNKVGEYEVKYSYLNVFKDVTRKVFVEDRIKPELKVPYTETYVAVNTEFQNPEVTANDNYDGDLTDKVSYTGKVDINNIGSYTLSYYVQDSSGNTTTKDIKVNVVNRIKENIIEVDIEKQKLTYYKDNELVLESDIVTGIRNKTPRGEFKILNKARNTYLVGKNYKSFVQYWIAFKDNVFGFHDASWRNTFGGNIYISNGSHGCVNMPLENVKKLYELADIGTKVVIE